MDYQDFRAIERRRRFLRIGLFFIILGTLPFYCAGFVLLGTAGRGETRQAGTTTPTYTPIGLDRSASSTPFPTLALPLTATQLGPLRPTPLQFNPPPVFPTATFFFPPTAVFIPTATLAPTLTPFPTTSVPPTATPLPTNTPLPTETPLPTDPPPTDPPPATEEPPIVIEPPTTEEAPGGG